MAMSQFARDYQEKMVPGYASDLLRTDPEFVDLFNNFALDEVVHEGKMDGKTRFIAILATLMGCQGIDEYRAMLPAALNFDVTPTEVKETVYQAMAYLGMGRVYPFLKATNEILEAKGIALPLEPQSTTTPENRVEKGEQAMVDICGEKMKGFATAGAPERQHINRFLAGNCFGDYYTRGGLDYKQREMITFCFLAAQGGCESQLTSHALNNMLVGNDKTFLIDVVTQCLPYIGYPRSLNALTCVEKAAEKYGK